MARILVIDDDETILTTLEQVLAAAGHTVTTAVDGLEAARQFRAAPFDLIITDIVMPQREGLETIITLRRDYPHIGVIAMSGGIGLSPTYLKMAARLGANRTLGKPFTPAQLFDAIAAVLARPAPPGAPQKID